LSSRAKHHTGAVIAIFGDELPTGSARTAVPPVMAVVIGADSDNTQARSSGWLAQVQWR
jgi:hypothetical protein